MGGTPLPANWISTLGVLLIIPQGYWLTSSQFQLTLKNMLIYINSKLGALFGPRALPGTLGVFCLLFIFTLFTNFLGLFPYVFTRSRHLSITLSLGLPLWLGAILWSIIFQLTNFISHLVPTGTPGPLIPFMVLIETVRNIIRLAANMVAGHLLLTLLGSQGALRSLLIILIPSQCLLLPLEVGVACIQAYVFTVLRSLYLSEVISKEFNVAQL